MSRDRVALISVRPRFAIDLLNGTKTVEIRRRSTRLTSGSICLVYASTPVCALLGALRIDRVEVERPDELWRRWGSCTALARDEYDAYVDGAPVASAIRVDATVRFAHPVPLAELRRRHREFVTPQSYRFVGDEELTVVLNGQRCELQRLQELAPHSSAWMAVDQLDAHLAFAELARALRRLRAQRSCGSAQARLPDASQLVGSATCTGGPAPR